MKKINITEELYKYITKYFETNSKDISFNELDSFMNDGFVSEETLCQILNVFEKTSSPIPQPLRNPIVALCNFVAQNQNIYEFLHTNCFCCGCTSSLFISFNQIIHGKHPDSSDWPLSEESLNADFFRFDKVLLNNDTLTGLIRSLSRAEVDEIFMGSNSEISLKLFGVLLGGEAFVGIIDTSKVTKILIPSLLKIIPYESELHETLKSLLSDEQPSLRKDHFTQILDVL